MNNVDLRSAYRGLATYSADAARVPLHLADNTNAQRGIGVRAFSALPGIGNALRITIRRREGMARVASALRELVA